MFQQLIVKTDAKNKRTVVQFWEKFNIRNAINNIDVPWEKVTDKCKNAHWKKIWLEVSKDYINAKSLSLDK